MKTRIIKRFAFFPKRIDKKRVWMKKYEIVQKYQYTEAYSSTGILCGFYKWVDCKTEM